MRCSSRSTTCLVSVLCAFLAAGAAVVRAQHANADEAVRAALTKAIQARMGARAEIRLEALRVDVGSLDDEAGLTATPEPGSRLERAVRFALTTPLPDGRPGTRRVGSAVAVVFAAVEHTRVARPVPSGAIVADTDLAVSHSETGPIPLAPLPVRADIVGGRAVRDLKAGELVTPALVRAQPLVKSGQTVRTTVRVGPVEAVGQAVARQSGHRNDRIRLINPESKRQMFGRVTGPGEVEVIHAR